MARKYKIKIIKITAAGKHLKKKYIFKRMIIKLMSIYIICFKFFLLYYCEKRQNCTSVQTTGNPSPGTVQQRSQLYSIEQVQQSVWSSTIYPILFYPNLYISCLVLSYPIQFRPILSYYIPTYHISFCPILSYFILPPTLCLMNLHSTN